MDFISANSFPSIFFDSLSQLKNLDLSNRHVIITGGRVKIGYATALKLLRSNSHVTVTTRFPASALDQFHQEEDYEIWKEIDVYLGLGYASR